MKKSSPGAVILSLSLGVILIILASGIGLRVSIQNTSSEQITPDVSVSAEPSPSPSPQVATLDEKASVWVKMLLSNFENPGTDVGACVDYKVTVDLTEVHYYFKERNKETEGAFGPDFGSTPCEVSVNLVERLYRDPMLLADKAVEWGIDGADNSPEAVIELENAPFEVREQLANKVLGFYANPDYVLSIEQRDEAYSSRSASAEDGVPSTSESSSDKESNVLVTKDEESGDTIKEDRLDCGLQDYGPPPPTPPTTPPVVTPPPTTPPLTPKSDNPADYRQPGDSGKGADVGTGTKPKAPAPTTPAEPAPAPAPTTVVGGNGVTDTPSAPIGSETGTTAPGATPAPTTAPTTTQPVEGGDAPVSTEVSGF